MEIWKDIPNYVGYYQVSNLGRVKSLERYVPRKDGSLCLVKSKMFSQRVCSSGYYMVDFRMNFKKKSFRVHQLVAMAFLNHKPNGYEFVVDHIDNNKLNNKLENIQIVTPYINTTKDKKGSSKYVGVHWDKIKNVWRARIKINGVNKSLGYHKTEELAYQARCEAINYCHSNTQE